MPKRNRQIDDCGSLTSNHIQFERLTSRRIFRVNIIECETCFSNLIPLKKKNLCQVYVIDSQCEKQSSSIK